METLTEKSITVRNIEVHEKSFEGSEIDLSNNHEEGTPDLSPTSSASHICDFSFSEGNDIKGHKPSSWDSHDSTHDYSPQSTDLSHSEIQDSSVEVLYFHLSKSLKQQEKPRLQRILNDLKDYYTPSKDISLLQFPELSSKLNMGSEPDSQINDDLSPVREGTIPNKGKKKEVYRESRGSPLRNPSSNEPSSKMNMGDNDTAHIFSFILLFGFIIVSFFYVTEQTDHKLIITQHEALILRMEMKIKSLEQTNELFCKK